MGPKKPTKSAPKTKAVESSHNTDIETIHHRIQDLVERTETSTRLAQAAYDAVQASTTPTQVGKKRDRESPNIGMGSDEHRAEEGEPQDGTEEDYRALKALQGRARNIPNLWPTSFYKDSQPHTILQTFVLGATLPLYKRIEYTKHLLELKTRLDAIARLAKIFSTTGLIPLKTELTILSLEWFNKAVKLCLCTTFPYVSEDKVDECLYDSIGKKVKGNTTIDPLAVAAAVDLAYDKVAEVAQATKPGPNGGEHRKRDEYQKKGFREGRN